MNVHRIDVVAAAIWDGVDKILIGKRAMRDSFPGVWEFVGGKAEEGEALEVALGREIDEELKIQIRVLVKLGEFDFTNKGRLFRLHVYFVQWLKGVPVAIEHDEICWEKDFSLSSRLWSKPDEPFLNAVSEMLKKMSQLS